MLSPVALVLWPVFSALQDFAPEDPLTLFRANCALCHTVPDPSLDTDRAWLAQIEETS